MGDIADMMIDGLLDCETGEFIDGAAPGFPRTRRGPIHEQPSPNKAKCPTCGKMVKKAGLTDHIRDVHRVGAKKV